MNLDIKNSLTCRTFLYNTRVKEKFFNLKFLDVREFLDIDSSRLNADILVDKIEEDTDLFETVWEIMFEDSNPVSMRAGRVIYLFGQKHPYFIEPRAPEIIKRLSSVKTEGVVRSLLGVLCMVPLPEDESGYLFDLCYNIVESPASAIAHKAYALTILYNISEMEPGLKPELITFFEEQLDTESAGIKARTRSLLNRLYRETGAGGTGYSNKLKR